MDKSCFKNFDWLVYVRNIIGFCILELLFVLYFSSFLFLDRFVFVFRINGGEILLGNKLGILVDNIMDMMMVRFIMVKVIEEIIMCFFFVEF